MFWTTKILFCLPAGIGKYYYLDIVYFLYTKICLLPICRTVKVWSLRSQGDGSAVMNPQWSYSQHKKSTFFVTFLAATQHAASCDSTVHVWDPFVGTGVHQVIEIFTLVLSRINEI